MSSDIFSVRDDSKTYKLKIPGKNEQTVYFTVVGGKNPKAFFINSKKIDNFQWITALMTAYSRQVSAGISIDEVISDMKDTFDPNGKYIIEDGSGREAHSVVHHLALILEQHLEEELET